MERVIEKYDRISCSTNLRLTELAREGAPEGSYVLADIQEGGRGRMGRAWCSGAAGDNIALSVLLRPDMDPGDVSMLTLVAAMAASDGIEAVTGVTSGIKWPNDMILGGKKIAGILSELHLAEGKTGWVILGIGINVGQVVFPPELESKATSLFLETGKRWDREKIVDAFLDSLWKYYWKFLEMGDLRNIREAYESRLVLKDREIRILPGDQRGVCVGISDRGGLLIRSEDKIEEITSGEVSVRGMEGYL